MGRTTLWAVMRRAEAAMRREYREEQARLRRLERESKDLAKLSALEQALLEVEVYKAQVSVLLSVHKEQSNTIDWHVALAALPPVEPSRTRHGELRARQDELLAAAGFGAFAAGVAGAAAGGREADEREYEARLQAYSSNRDEWIEWRAVAARVVEGDLAAFGEVLAERGLFDDSPDVCAATTVVVHDRHVAEVRVLVRGREIIPAETKALTATRKVSAKPMPKGLFHELFQDYVASCAIRAAREVFGLLPLEHVLVTASVPIASMDGHAPAHETPVLSVAFSRELFTGLPFASLDPSDTVEGFPHRGDVKVSRKTGEFIAIVPLSLEDVPKAPREATSLEETIATARALREEIEAKHARLTETAEVEGLSSGDEE